MLLAVILNILIYYGTKGCLFSPSLSLSLIPVKTKKALVCNICTNQDSHTQHIFTFKLSLLKGKVQSIKKNKRGLLYLLDPNKNENQGLWRCEVEEYANISVEYYLGPTTTVSPIEMKSTTTEETFVEYNTENTRILLTSIIVVVATFTLIAVLLIPSRNHFIGRCRRTSLHHKLLQGNLESNSWPLTDDFHFGGHIPSPETDDNVSYVELDLVQKSECRPANPRSTIYASIV
ncbi:hypothetical protein XENTR_v10021306 [Xenopus tropicalis]|uniref:Uncharacterized protein LOC105948211 n=1 Tax=Xenopus tropicalis TaxID=8364 RepID=A0A8J1IR20_XENTR|nr:uncharacterized protein LOC105948211 [Xenopus tropicalis]KAE8585419.1 hypothetical protein XENTR_v10021306 [Xenopus tropicalis]